MYRSIGHYTRTLLSALHLVNEGLQNTHGPKYIIFFLTWRLSNL